MKVGTAPDMPINPTHRSSGLRGTSDVGSHARTATLNVGEDQPHISRIAGELAMVAMQGPPGVSAERVQELKEAVANGTYAIDAAAIAAALWREDIGR